MNIGGIEFEVLPEPCAEDDHEYVEESCYVDDALGRVFYPLRCTKCKHVSYSVSEIEKLGPHTLELRRNGLWR